MKKRILSIIFAAVFLLTAMVSAMAYSAQDENSDLEQKFGIQFPPEVDENTFAEKRAERRAEYENFADADSTYAYPETKSMSVNVVGTVLTTEDIPVPGAMVSVAGLNVYTDDKGRFQIKDMPKGTYDWYISAEGYQGSEYLNYSLSYYGGTNIFKFRLDPEEKIIKEKRNVIRNDSQTAESSPSEPAITNLSMTSLPTIEPYVTVESYPNPFSRYDYLVHATSSELYATDQYIDAGMSVDELTQLYLAQAIASNSYVTFAQEEKDVANHPNDDFDICGNADHCQNFDDDLAYELVQDVVDHVIINSLGEDRAIIVLYQPEAQTYEFACANFFGACLGMGTDNDSYNPELKAKPCTDWDGLPLHESTRKKGMCQAGAAYKAINGTNAGDILRYYYDNCNTFYCVME